MLDQMAIDQQWSIPVITVAGTNGKGSSVAMLEAIYHQAGYRVGSYTSPHLLCYNERIRINRQMVGDQQLCEAFERVDQARCVDNRDVPLTYFEFGTLAALDLLKRAALDVVILEVGLGGRLDAVNVIEPDVALITTIDIDHQAWLGDSREQIAREKAGIFRANKPAVCGDIDPPDTIEQIAEDLHVELFRACRDFNYAQSSEDWSWHDAITRYEKLSLPSLSGDIQLQNASAVIQVVQLLQSRLPVAQQAICTGLESIELAGRFQPLAERPQVIVDVAHNTQAVQNLVDNLRRHPSAGNTWVVLAMLEDKDICAALRVVDDQVTSYFLAGLAVPRGLTAQALQQRIQACVTSDKLQLYDTVAEAVKQAMKAASADDRIIVFGSFYAVTETMHCLQRQQNK